MFIVGPSLGNDLGHLVADPLLGAVGTRRGVCLHPGGVQSHQAHPHQAELDGQGQHLSEEPFQLGLVVLGEAGDGAVVGDLVGADPPKGDVLGAAPLDLA